MILQEIYGEEIMFEEVKDIVGEENFSDGLADRYIYSSHASIHQSLPSVILRPGKAEEVQDCLLYTSPSPRD